MTTTCGFDPASCGGDGTNTQRVKIAVTEVKNGLNSCIEFVPSMTVHPTTDSLAISPGGIPFGTNGKLTDIFFLICSASEHEHLRILARLSRVINDQNFLAAMREAHNPVALHALVAEREATIRDK